MSAIRLAKASIRIPKRIERGPTDILKALASTVKFIPKEPDSILQDDPFLLPKKFSERRIYTLAKLSGQETARYFLDKYPELFFRDDAEPKIEAFHPKEVFTPDMSFNEEDIKWCISKRDPVNASIAFQRMKSDGISISDETLMQLFELFCYSNEEPLNDDKRAKFVSDDEVKPVWNSSGLASTLFSELKDKDPGRIHSAYIAGLSKYRDHAAARQVFQDFVNNYSAGLYPEAYDGLIRSVGNLNSSITTAYEAVDEIVAHMAKACVLPTLEIFNSILSCYRIYTISDETCQKGFQLLNDMETLKIEPSLFTLAQLISMVCRYKRGQVYGELVTDILEFIGSSDSILQVKDPRDTEFFSLSNNAIVNTLHSLTLAKKLHKIFMKNPQIFSNQRFRLYYLNNLLKFMTTTDKQENILEFYENFVPMQFSPRQDCEEALAEVLNL